MLFVKALKKADSDRICKEEEKHAFARLQLEEYHEEMEGAQQERHQKREAAVGLDLCRIWLMLDMFAQRDRGSGAPGSSVGPGCFTHSDQLRNSYRNGGTHSR